MSIRIVHYLNQFFGQIGGEDKAGISPLVKLGPVGPGVLLQNLVKDDGEVVGTVICGDNYFVEHEEATLSEVLEQIASLHPDVVVAGPAFNAGRYGPACGTICKGVQEQLGIPAVTGMYPQNPGLDIFQRYIYCIETPNSAVGMGKSMPKMASLALSLARGEKPSAEEGGYLPRGLRSNRWMSSTGSKRAVEMLLAKIAGLPYETEIPLTKFDRVPVAKPLEGTSTAKIALVTEGGLVPNENPDRLESSKATNFYRYSFESENGFVGAFQSVHGGYNTEYVNANPNRLVPVDVLRELEHEGVIGSLHPYFFTTTGNQTTLDNAKKFGREIAQSLLESHIDAVIFTST